MFLSIWPVPALVSMDATESICIRMGEDGTVYQGRLPVQWFVEHSAGDHSLDLTAPGGMGTAVRYLKWLGANMPGYEYPRKKDTMVMSPSS